MDSRSIVAFFLLFALSFVSFAGAAPSGSPVATIAGPLTIDSKGVLAAGVGACQNEIAGAPFDCNSSTGSTGGAGAYVLNTTGCAGIAGCYYDFWAIQASGIAVTGWGITVCNDRDDSGVCTNVGSNFDDAGFGYLGEEISGEDKEKEDPDWAHLSFCVRPDIDGTYDDVWVFISAWEDENIVAENPNDNTGSGVGLGTFDIFIENETPVNSDCFADGDKGLCHIGDSGDGTSSMASPPESIEDVLQYGQDVPSTNLEFAAPVCLGWIVIIIIIIVLVLWPSEAH